MCLVTLRPVFSLREHLFSSMTTDVRGYPLSLVKDLDSGWCRSNFHAFLHQRVGHAVEVSVEGDVIVDVDSRIGPLAHDPSRFLNGRWFSRSSSSRIAWFKSASRKNFWWRRAAIIQRSATCTPTSTLALSRAR